MPRAATALRLAYAALAATDAALAGSAAPRAHRIRRVTKPLLVPVLAASLAAHSRSATSPLRGPTLAGQAFGWLGDIALLGRGDGAFVAGMAAFGAGQAAYVHGLRRVQAPEPVFRTGLGRSALLIWATSAPPIALAAARQQRALGPAVLMYAAALTTMAAHAAHLHPALPPGARVAGALGGLAFLTSDALLGTGKFLRDDPPAGLESAVMATYAAAQYLLAETAVRLGS